MQISKSDYMMFLRHPAWLWLKKHDKSKLPPVDDNTQALFDSGHKFEPYAESQFPEGVSLGFSDYDEYLSLPQRTQDAIARGDEVLFQPRFEWEQFTCICDIVSIVESGIVDLYEIKASTGVRPEHELDLAFQVAVLEGAGLMVRKIFVVHVNNKYMRQGAIEADKITHTVDVTEEVRGRAEFTLKNMQSAMVVAMETKMPDPAPELAKLGSKKDWLQIYANIVPSEPKVWPEDTAPVIQYEEIKQFLGELKFPLYFLDYETLMSLVPYFDGQRPYQQIPFQYSLHILESPVTEPQQREYLHRENSDPSRPLTEQLIKDIGTEGTVLVWYEGFEKARNTELGTMLPEYKDALEAINTRVVDLITPFKSKWYVDPRFEGRTSIKYVLPVMCSELSYKTLGIQEGGSAQRLWMEAVLDDKRADQKEKILSDLVEYCSLDTLAMVKIYQVLLGL
ncbi:MAG: DUF2779 domain-containing protein [Candidatus Saccharibacteria bacterium]